MRAVRGARHRAHLPGADDGAQPGLHRRRPDCRGACGCTAPARARRARARAVELLDAVQDPGRRPARARLPAPAVGRPAAAGADRDGAGLPAVARRSPTSRPPRSTSPSRRRSSTCCARCATAFGLSLLLITHDLGVRRRHGRPRRRDVRRAHRRTGPGARYLHVARASVHARPARVAPARPAPARRLQAIDGSVPRLDALPPGARSRRDAPNALDACAIRPPNAVTLGPDREVRCYLHTPATSATR